MRFFHDLRDYAGQLVNGWGKPNVCDDGDVRSLHFSSGAVQSSMRVSEPFELNLSYTRTMMGFLLFNPEPRHILQVGLGGGSLSKYCYQQFPQARITTLEINPDVIALRDRFLIPRDDNRFTIVHADACDYLATSDASADVILLDGYDATGLPVCLCSESFYANCWRGLTASGVLVANYWGGEANRKKYLNRLRETFDGRVWWCKPVNSTSVVAFAVKDPYFFPHPSRLKSKALALGAQYRLEFPWIAKNLKSGELPAE